MRYMVVIEHGKMIWGARVSDLPGRIAVGEQCEDVVRLNPEVMDFHIRDLAEGGHPVLLSLQHGFGTIDE